MPATAPDADHDNWPTPDEIAAVAEFLISRSRVSRPVAPVPAYVRN